MPPGFGRHLRALALAIGLSLALSTSGSSSLAQETGSSFGGGDWGGAGSSSAGSGSGGSNSGGGYDAGGGGGSSGGTGNTTVDLLLGMIVVGAGIWIFAGDWLRSLRSKLASRWTRVDVTALRIAVDWRARRQLQASLDRLARSGKTKTKQGLVDLLREATRLLTGVRAGWLYGGATNHRPRSKADAQGTFAALGVDARSRFKRDQFRAEGNAVVEGELGALEAKPEEGPGVVVVTIVVAATRALRDIRRPGDADELEGALTALGGLDSQQLIALEVIWSPSAEDDRMSTAELEALYPELVRVDEATVGGRVFCRSCAGPFAEELAKCPRCGAPS